MAVIYTQAPSAVQGVWLATTSVCAPAALCQRVRKRVLQATVLYENVVLRDVIVSLLTVSRDGSKLSKRHNAVHLEAFKVNVICTLVLSFRCLGMPLSAVLYVTLGVRAYMRGLLWLFRRAAITRKLLSRGCVAPVAGSRDDEKSCSISLSLNQQKLYVAASSTLNAL